MDMTMEKSASSPSLNRSDYWPKVSLHRSDSQNSLNNKNTNEIVEEEPTVEEPEVLESPRTRQRRCSSSSYVNSVCAVQAKLQVQPRSSPTTRRNAMKRLSSSDLNVSGLIATAAVSDSNDQQTLRKSQETLVNKNLLAKSLINDKKRRSLDFSNLSKRSFAHLLEQQREESDDDNEDVTEIVTTTTTITTTTTTTTKRSPRSSFESTLTQQVEPHTQQARRSSFSNIIGELGQVFNELEKPKPTQLKKLSRSGSQLLLNQSPALSRPLSSSERLPRDDVMQPPRLQYADDSETSETPPPPPPEDESTEGGSDPIEKSSSEEPSDHRSSSPLMSPRSHSKRLRSSGKHRPSGKLRQSGRIEQKNGSLRQSGRIEQKNGSLRRKDEKKNSLRLKEDINVRAKPNALRHAAASPLLARPRSFIHRRSKASPRHSSSGRNRSHKKHHKERKLTQPTEPKVDIEVEDLLVLARSLVGNDNSAADVCFKRALLLAPHYPRTLALYAIYNETILKDFAQAESLYQEAAFSGKPNHIHAYADFLENVRDNHELSKQLHDLADGDFAKVVPVLLSAGARPPPPSPFTHESLTPQRDEDEGEVDDDDDDDDDIVSKSKAREQARQRLQNIKDESKFNSAQSAGSNSPDHPPPLPPTPAYEDIHAFDEIPESPTVHYINSMNEEQRNDWMRRQDSRRAAQIEALKTESGMSEKPDLPPSPQTRQERAHSDPPASPLDTAAITAVAAILRDRHVPLGVSQPAVSRPSFGVKLAGNRAKSTPRVARDIKQDTLPRMSTLQWSQLADAIKK